MPKKVERKLRREARREHFGRARTNRYVYGTLAKIKARKAKR